MFYKIKNSITLDGTYLLPKNKILKVNKFFSDPLCAHPSTFFILVSCSSYSSALKMEATCGYESLSNFQRITWRYITLFSRFILPSLSNFLVNLKPVTHAPCLSFCLLTLKPDRFAVS
jgi:hypothetical protein